VVCRVVVQAEAARQRLGAEEHPAVRAVGPLAVGVLLLVRKLAFVNNEKVVKKILEHLGLPTAGRPTRGACGPFRTCGFSPSWPGSQLGRSSSIQMLPVVSVAVK
jgi:hypothetical protein